ncbi:NAD(P)/FAD-dependent oxidoreductase [Candidatus Caldatribacterium sp.]|uniref:NAD(P)/FAD-dependent oxidoreductase n=1 Tax=Candidatus Caldatribacterium sp. TaxID=2282143 RepID=UPI002997D147|nr:FAD-dependent oxidoreductase [Candidatus Caldatribacterium sp.]MDW8080564.1 FAD-dependent oxidoreductase [Candidatus Calescibacterium sp.]
MRVYDVVIAGGGVVGCAIAWYLAHFSLDVLLLEKCADVCCGVSKANTGILHSRSYVAPGTLKGEMHLRSLSWFPQAFRELGLRPLCCGALTLAFSKEEAEHLKVLQERGKVEGAAILSPKEVLVLEPCLHPRVYAGYFDPETMVISPFSLTIALAECAVLNGVTMHFAKEVSSVEALGGYLLVRCGDGEAYATKFFVNCAGIGAPRLAERIGDSVPFLSLFRGQYFVLDRECQGLVRHVLYPVPTEESKGILVSPTPEGNVLLGPNFEAVSWEDTATTLRGLEEVERGARKLVPDLPLDKVITTFSGIRPATPKRDFSITPSSRFSSVFHLVGIESPGLTACFGIAEYVGELLKRQGLPLRERSGFQPRIPPPVFRECSLEERERLIAQDPDWGKIVCRCEEVTLAEVKRALRSNPPARTLDGLKRRIRVFAGRCQGGFCGMHLPGILEREFGFSPLEIRKSGPGSFYVLRRNGVASYAEVH